MTTLNYQNIRTVIPLATILLLIASIRVEINVAYWLLDSIASHNKRFGISVNDIHKLRITAVQPHINVLVFKLRWCSIQCFGNKDRNERVQHWNDATSIFPFWFDYCRSYWPGRISRLESRLNLLGAIFNALCWLWLTLAWRGNVIEVNKNLRTTEGHSELHWQMPRVSCDNGAALWMGVGSTMKGWAQHRQMVPFIYIAIIIIIKLLIQ